MSHYTSLSPLAYGARRQTWNPYLVAIVAVSAAVFVLGILSVLVGRTVEFGEHGLHVGGGGDSGYDAIKAWIWRDASPHPTTTATASEAKDQDPAVEGQVGDLELDGSSNIRDETEPGASKAEGNDGNDGHANAMSSADAAKAAQGTPRVDDAHTNIVAADADSTAGSTSLNGGGQSGQLEDETADQLASGHDATSNRLSTTCSDAVVSTVSSPSFWIVRELRPLSYTISPRSTRPITFPSHCLTSAIFSARLVRASSAAGSETIVALPRPHFVPGSVATYALILPDDVTAPRAVYQLEVRLEFAYLPGALEGQICGERALACVPTDTGALLGDKVAFSGELVSFETAAGSSARSVTAGSASIAEAEADAPLCTTFSPLDGYWRNGRYHPVVNGSPCRLHDIEFPLAFVPSSEQRAQALASTSAISIAPPIIWLHFVGDSNSRNLFSELTKQLGLGPLTHAAAWDSPAENWDAPVVGSAAAMALRARSGDLASGPDAPLPDIVLTWAWWFQHAPATSASEETHANAIFNSDAASLATLANTTLESFTRQFAGFAGSLGQGALADKAKTMRPFRTYVSLGSHSEQLTAEGQRMSLARLFRPWGLGDVASDDASTGGLRLITTTHVNVRGIPVGRFPRQDLVRNNAAIETKNRVVRDRFSSKDNNNNDDGRGGRRRKVLDVGRMTSGLTDPNPPSAGVTDARIGWMRTYGDVSHIDAVHFVDEVYVEWSRLIVTELVDALRI